MKVTIDRAKWNTGRRFGIGVLLTNRNHVVNQTRCCLGFLGQACGISDDYLRETAFPSEVGFESQWPEQLFAKSGYAPAGQRLWKWEEIFADINDALDTDHPTRESWIAEGFRIVLGVEVEFIGEYP